MTSLYVHIPFCERKCFYCSFVVSIGQKHQIDSYLDCLTKEAGQYKETKVDSIYIGGGTPTLISNIQLERLFKIVNMNIRYSCEEMECTIEANPESLDISKAKLLKKLGINRISLGVQSMNDKYLRYLGRNHNRKTVINAFDVLRKAKFDNINLDLMYSFPHQTTEEIMEDVTEITKLGSEHLSLYALDLEEHSRFYTQKIQLQDDLARSEQYVLVSKLLEVAGFKQYEVSNFAKPGKISKHNLNYWQGGQYVGLGVGAHSHINGKRFWNVSRLHLYMSCIREEASAEENFEQLTSDTQFKEMLLFGLRMNQGVNLSEVEKFSGCSLSQEKQKKIKAFIKEGFLVREGVYLKTSPKGRLVLDELCAQLI